jgi:micrococcal nuclease
MRLLLILFLFCTSCTAPSSKESSLPPSTTYPITEIVDGDTFWTRRPDGTRFKVRLIGIDAPETRNSANKRASPFGEVSKAYLKERLHNQSVHLVVDVDSLDRYGRTLAYVYLPDGSFINEELIREGYATLLTFPPNVRHVERFTAAQHEARRQRKGLWADS